MLRLPTRSDQLSMVTLIPKPRTIAFLEHSWCYHHSIVLKIVYLESMVSVHITTFTWKWKQCVGDWQIHQSNLSKPRFGRHCWFAVMLKGFGIFLKNFARDNHHPIKSPWFAISATSSRRILTSKTSTATIESCHTTIFKRIWPEKQQNVCISIWQISANLTESEFLHAKKWQISGVRILLRDSSQRLQRWGLRERVLVKNIL